LVTTKNIKHGVTHAFSFPHRFVRISEMIEERIKVKKVNEFDMMEMQQDVLDI
jgi:hypothetical protein